MFKNPSPNILHGPSSRKELLFRNTRASSAGGDKTIKELVDVIVQNSKDTNSDFDIMIPIEERKSNSPPRRPEYKRLTKDETRELNKLRRRYGWQPSGFTQKLGNKNSH